MLTTSSDPFRHAVCKAVLPYPLTASTVAPAFNNRSTIAALDAYSPHASTGATEPRTAGRHPAPGAVQSLRRASLFSF